MSTRDDGVSLRHMLDYAREAVTLVKGKIRENVEADRLLQLSLTRLVEVVGEAATRAKHPGIPWPHITGRRNRLIHGYDVLDWDLLWDTVCDDLGPPISELERIGDEFK